MENHSPTINKKKDNSALESIENTTENQLQTNKDDNNWEEKWWETRRRAEDERIKKYRAKQAKSNAGYSYKETKESDNHYKISVDGFDDTSLTEKQKSESILATYCAISGSADQDFARLISSQSVSASFKSEAFSYSGLCNAYTGALLGMAPQDEFEGMLCNKLLTLHNQQMHNMNLVTNPKNTEAQIDLYINRATKLGRLYNETLDALNKHRRNGKQEVFVNHTHQHVNVNDGGQAIVAGNLTPRGGGNKQKVRE